MTLVTDTMSRKSQHESNGQGGNIPKLPNAGGKKRRMMPVPLVRAKKMTRSTFPMCNRLLNDFPLKRLNRVKRLRREGKNKGGFVWAKENQNKIVHYKDDQAFVESLYASVATREDEQGHYRPIPPPSLAKRRQIGQTLSFHHFTQALKNLSDEVITQHNRCQDMFHAYGTFHTKQPSLMYVVGISHSADELAAMYTENDGKDTRLNIVHRTVDGTIFGNLVLMVSKHGNPNGNPIDAAGGMEELPGNEELPSEVRQRLHSACPRAYVSVPVLFASFNSFLDCPKLSWKSVSGTRASTLRIFADREGIHTAALQDIDSKTQHRGMLPVNLNMNLIVVHDEKHVSFSDVDDIVKCTPTELSDMIASRICNLPWEYCDETENIGIP